MGARTGWPSISILRVGETCSFICNLYLSVVVCKIVSVDPSLSYTVHVAGTLSHKQTTNTPPLTRMKDMKQYLEYKAKCRQTLPTCVRNVCWSHDSPDLFHGLQVWRQTWTRHINNNCKTQVFPWYYSHVTNINKHSCYWVLDTHCSHLCMLCFKANLITFFIVSLFQIYFKRLSHLQCIPLALSKEQWIWVIKCFL